jgi:hypothetical protein
MADSKDGGGKGRILDRKEISIRLEELSFVKKNLNSNFFIFGGN